MLCVTGESDGGDDIFRTTDLVMSKEEGRNTLSNYV